MSRILMAVVVLLAASLGGASVAGEGEAPTAAGLSPMPIRLSFMDRLLSYAMYGSRIQRGMTRAEVEGIIGKDRPCSYTGRILGRLEFCQYHYYTLGLRITYENRTPDTREVTDTLRVSEIDFDH
jgi:hypothetical protein